MRAIQIIQTGGPEVLTLNDIPTPTPGDGEVLVRHHAIGLNFIDIYQRTGLYPLKLPTTMGLEAAGVVEALGPNVTRFQIGDRIAYCKSLGAYADANIVKQGDAVKVPEGVSFETSAAVMLKGLTAEFLARRIWTLTSGDSVLVHAAAGGVGQILSQWLSALGIRVIGAVGSAEKAELALKYGCESVINYNSEDVAARVRTLTHGTGVKVVYDSVGASTFDASLASLQRRGLLVSFGNASGPPPAVDVLRLSRGGSLFLTRPTLFDYIGTTEELDTAASALFDVIASGKVKIDIGQRFSLENIGQAHEALASRKTVGATVVTL